MPMSIACLILYIKNKSYQSIYICMCREIAIQSYMCNGYECLAHREKYGRTNLTETW